MSEDLIKRSDAIETAYQLRHKPNDEEWEDWLKSFNAIPSADRPKGKWIRDRYWSRGTGMGEEYGFFYKCSLCEYEVENGYARCGFNFCPYCGADMRKGADDE